MTNTHLQLKIVASGPTGDIQLTSRQHSWFNVALLVKHTWTLKTKSFNPTTPLSTELPWTSTEVLLAGSGPKAFKHHGWTPHISNHAVSLLPCMTVIYQILQSRQTFSHSLLVHSDRLFITAPRISTQTTAWCFAKREIEYYIQQQCELTDAI